MKTSSDNSSTQFEWIELSNPRLISDNSKKILYGLIKSELESEERTSKLARTKEELKNNPPNKTIYSYRGKNYLLSNSIIPSETFSGERTYYLLHKNPLGTGANAKFIVSQYQIKLNNEEQSVQFLRISRGVKVLREGADKREASVATLFSLKRNKYVGEYEQSYSRINTRKGHSVQPLLPRYTLENLLNNKEFANKSEYSILSLYKKMLILLKDFHSLGYRNWDFQNPKNILISKDCRNTEFVDFSGFAYKTDDYIKFKEDLANILNHFLSIASQRQPDKTHTFLRNASALWQSQEILTPDDIIKLVEDQLESVEQQAVTYSEEDINTLSKKVAHISNELPLIDKSKREPLLQAINIFKELEDIPYAEFTINDFIKVQSCIEYLETFEHYDNIPEDEISNDQMNHP